MKRLKNRWLNKLGAWWQDHKAQRDEWSNGDLDRQVRTHVILLDGTMSTLEFGKETNIGLIYKLLSPTTPQRTLFYSGGIQWDNWKSSIDVMLGRGLGRQIWGAYGALSNRYRPGDKIFIFGYSRGAFAARSLTGMIDQVGLLKPKFASQRNVQRAWHLYRTGHIGQRIRFKQKFCQEDISIEMVGLFDTVSALKFKIPIIGRLLPDQYSFHCHQIADCIKNGYHAVALDEARVAYSLEKWDLTQLEPYQTAEQVWFRGSHGDIGGHIGHHHEARPLANIPLCWILEHAHTKGLELPNEWKAKFPTDPHAPSVGMWRGVGALLLFRRKRVVDLENNEWVHSSVEIENTEELERSAL